MSLAAKITRLAFLALGGLVLLLWSGCGTVEDDARNASTRPWNTPKSWETGLPSTINEGR